MRAKPDLRSDMAPHLLAVWLRALSLGKPRGRVACDGVVVRLQRGLRGAHLRLSAEFVSPHLPRSSCPAESTCRCWLMGAPKLQEGRGPQPSGLHLVIIPQRKLGREGELWVLPRKGLLGFDTFAPNTFCSGGPGRCRGGVGFFWSERLLGSDLSICPSAGPSIHLCSIHLSAHSLILQL